MDGAARILWRGRDGDFEDGGGVRRQPDLVSVAVGTDVLEQDVHLVAGGNRERAAIVAPREVQQRRLTATRAGGAGRVGDAGDPLPLDTGAGAEADTPRRLEL